MKKLSSVMGELIPYVYSDRLFHLPAHKEKILKATRKLSVHAHDIKPRKEAPENDISLEIISDRLKRATNNAYNDLREGRWHAAQAILKTVMSSCVACHTRHSLGPQYLSHENQTGGAALSPIERADYFVSIRDYDRSLKILFELIDSKKTSKVQRLQWEKAIKKALVISVRQQNDPRLSMNIIKKALKNKNISYYFKWDVLIWQKTVEKWIRENKKRSSSEKNDIKRAEALIEEAHKLWDSTRDESALIHFLRVSSIMHNYLSQHPKTKDKGKALYLLAYSYDALSGLELGALHELFYQKCIETSPRSYIARQCFRRLEENWSGQSQKDMLYTLPPGLNKRLEELRKKAIPR